MKCLLYYYKKLKSKYKEYFTKNRKLLDSDTSIWEVLQHCIVNGLNGLLGGLTIASLTIGNPYIILASYYALKQVESRILNRNKYTTRLGKYYIFPIPSTLGFMLGWYISNIIKILLNE